ncbi:MAG TPA: sulfotransferase domain-containing protein [Longimicrobium sp.]
MIEPAFKMALPNLVIAGAPKCGTSSLFGWLADHPQVCGARSKETFYLMDPGHPISRPEGTWHQHGLDGYRRWFDGQDRPGARVWLEATTHYLYQETAPRVLAALDPVPDIVFVLRRPADRVYSSFQYTRNNLAALRPDTTLAEYLALDADDSGNIVSGPRWRGSIPLWRSEVDLSCYARHLERWARLFPREKLHIVLLEDLTRDPRGTLQSLARSVGIDEGFYAEYPFVRRNESYQVRSHRLHELGWQISRRLPRMRLRTYLRDAYLRLATRKPSGLRDDDAAVLRDLDAFFVPHNERLAREFGVDLRAWER